MIVNREALTSVVDFIFGCIGLQACVSIPFRGCGSGSVLTGAVLAFQEGV